MINREATKIDLILDEELNEYEEMKNFRLNNPKEFEELFSINEINNNFPLFQDFQFTLNQFNENENSYNKDSNDKKYIVEEFNINNSNSNNKNYSNNNSDFIPKAFNLETLISSNKNSSSSKREIQNQIDDFPSVQQFQTPHNK
jgi:hypothetical protein